MKCEREQCDNEVLSVAGKQQRRFCSDKCRKASKRADSKKSEATTSSLSPELRTISTKPPTPDTSEVKCGQEPKDVGITFDDNGDVHVPDAVFTKLMAQAGPGHIRVSKPGDADYVPMCQTTRDWMANHV